ncbi:MAG: hypothetical protein Q7S44_01255 [bacterium]|nr:hypothetical protein [bacterium]
MRITKRAVTSAFATASLLFYAFATSAFAQTTTLDISGNGSDSDNTLNVTTSQTTTVVQENNADITNDVYAKANTGGNDANDNTGGDVTVDTGDATTNVDISNQANANVADLQNCGTCVGDTSVTISGNGSDSDNDVDLDLNHETELFQNNNADINNDVYAKANTGKNEAEDDTGGDVTIRTGDADTTVDITNKANANVASIGNGGNNNGGVSLRISGNGSDSDNSIDLDLDKSITLVQNNNADINNDVYAKANTGKNEAEDNTGGDVLIDTGDASTDVTVDNAANFNWANVDCCLFDVVAKILGNGSDSDNSIKAEIDNNLEVFQNNCAEHGHETILSVIDGHGKCGIDNDLYAKADSGDNEAEDNTGPVSGGDPTEVKTGDAESNTDVSNSANLNILGQDQSLELPEGIDFSFDFSFDLNDLLGMLSNLTV